MELVFPSWYFPSLTCILTPKVFNLTVPLNVLRFFTSKFVIIWTLAPDKHAETVSNWLWLRGVLPIADSYSTVSCLLQSLIPRCPAYLWSLTPRWIWHAEFSSKFEFLHEIETNAKRVQPIYQFQGRFDLRRKSRRRKSCVSFHWTNQLIGRDIKKIHKHRDWIPNDRIPDKNPEYP